MWARVFVTVMVVLAVGLLACAGAAVVGTFSGRAPVSDEASGPPPTPAAVVSASPAPGAGDVAPDRAPSLTVEHGRIGTVALVGSDGTAVAGSVSPDGHRWMASGALAYGETYTWSGNVDADAGGAQPITGAFTTVTPERTVGAHVNVGDGDVVGVGAPIIVQFDHHVTDKAAAERAMQVRTSVPTVGAWAWLDDDNGGSRAHWRPKDYWQPGTQVSVAIHQFGVDDGDGVWGRADVTSQFSIGRSQVVRADVDSHEMVVVRDGQVVMTVPASYGLGSDPNRNTTNGIHVVMSKAETVLMSNPEYGYENVPEHWAVRIENNGEFIHANPDTTGEQGSTNVTHGCVNLSTADAHAYFDTAIFGDPVEVTNSPIPLTAADGDISDWTVPWDQWVAQSALRS
ncbi:lipoprotein-anchoring transpeptidase ErfK/SrfK [Actinomycetospora succinea]|uniref:Lipoprotein-anchoring transpeptidase ErfK/SrfK n=1 Tax=Actinomycetospora succinea TaxID=663603 RepID=A0A4R6UTY5_9PSEU|nr:lipoprotein-anchoring transpeptidase ErfK/SrfK [Actinomycetospora succinea]